MKILKIIKEINKSIKEITKFIKILFYQIYTNSQILNKIDMNIEITDEKDNDIIGTDICWQKRVTRRIPIIKVIMDKEKLFDIPICFVCKNTIKCMFTYPASNECFLEFVNIKTDNEEIDKFWKGYHKLSFFEKFKIYKKIFENIKNLNNKNVLEKI